MNITRRTYFSLPMRGWRGGQTIDFSDAQLDLIQGLAKKVNDSSYSVEVFARFATTDSPTANLAMTSTSL